MCAWVSPTSLPIGLPILAYAAPQILVFATTKLTIPPNTTTHTANITTIRGLILLGRHLALPTLGYFMQNLQFSLSPRQPNPDLNQATN